MEDKDREVWVRESRLYLGEDNIGYVTLIGEVDEKTANTFIDAILKMMNMTEGTVNFLVDVNKTGKLSTEARGVFKEMSEHEKTGKVAVFGMHPVAKVLAFFVMGISLPLDRKRPYMVWLSLLERSNLQQFLLSLRPLPVDEEFLLVDRRPFDHEPHHARRQATGKDGQVANFDQSDVAAVLRMEMRWVVIVKEHLDDDAEEPADLRHTRTRDARRGKGLPVSCPWL